MCRLILLTFAYFVTGWLGLQLPFVGTHITLVWLPTGIAVAALVRWGWQVWPGIYLGAFLVNFSIGSAWYLAAAIAVGNTLGPILSAAWLIHIGFHSEFDRQKDVGSLVIAAAMGMTLSALGGVVSLNLAGLISLEAMGPAGLSWWLGDTVGALLAAPLLLTMTWENLRHLQQARNELFVWLLVSGIVAWFALVHDYGGIGRSLPLAFMTIPLLTWAGLRFGNTGVALAALSFSFLAAWGTAIGQGGFVLPDTQTSLILLWIYMATAVLTGLLITALQAERSKIEKDLRLSTECLNDAQRIAHIGSWNRDLIRNDLTWSDENFNLFEIDRDRFQATYEAFLNAVHPDDREAVNRAYTKSLIDRTPYEITHRLLMSDGRIKWVHEHCKTDFDAKGNPVRSQGTVQDITDRKQIEAKLAESESRLRAIIDNEPECIKLLDADGRLLQMNPAGLAIIEADSLEQVLGCLAFDLIGPEHRAAFMEMHKRVLAGESMEMEYEVIGLKGGRRWLETHAVPMKLADGNVVHLAVTRDISERKQAEDQLRIAATVFESQEGMVVTDAQNKILRVNKAFTDITGYSAEEVVGKDPCFLQSGRHDEDFYAAMWETIVNTGSWEGEIWNRRKNGEIFPDYLTVTAVRNQNNVVSHYVATHMDITLRKAAAEEIERLAYYDPLTQLPNRRLLQDRLRPALAASNRSGRRGALLFIDLDNFKTLNDTLGHDMGDLLLKNVAERLSACVREGDTVARLGGDEFVVMLLDLSQHPVEAAKQAEITGEKILTALNRPYQLGKHVCSSTPSIGATLFHGHDRGVDDLLKHADIAMYQAKTSGRNALVFFDPQMQEAITARFQLEDELRKAFDNEQFQLYYQLQVDDKGRSLGAEALIRWVHPERGLMSPVDFIPLAEEIGLIHSIGHWVLETACLQLVAWQDEPAFRGSTLSVNVSAKQFFHANFVERVRTVVQHHAFNPGLLKLELTESFLLKNIDDTITTMNALQEIGVQFSLDDFGTGYSSLQYIKKLPLSQLKIDQSFIRDIANNNSDQAIVRTIIAMADSMNLNVIAEGVETEEQRQFLRVNGCTNFQGYLFGRPLPIAEFNALLTQGRTEVREKKAAIMR